MVEKLQVDRRATYLTLSFNSVLTFQLFPRGVCLSFRLTDAVIDVQSFIIFDSINFDWIILTTANSLDWMAIFRNWTLRPPVGGCGH